MPPTTIPLLPVSDSILLPRGRLPLALTTPQEQALASHVLAMPGRMVGVIQRESASRLYGVGCLGRVVGFMEEEQGPWRLNLQGRLRFTLIEETASLHPWRQGRVSYEAWSRDPDSPDIVLGPRRQALIRAVRRFFASRNMTFAPEMIDRFPDAVLPTALCAACPFPAREKQALLEAVTEDERVELLMVLLEMAAEGGQGMQMMN